MDSMPTAGPSRPRLPVVAGREPGSMLGTDEVPSSLQRKNVGGIRSHKKERDDFPRAPPSPRGPMRKERERNDVYEPIRDHDRPPHISSSRREKERERDRDRDKRDRGDKDNERERERERDRNREHHHSHHHSRSDDFNRGLNGAPKKQLFDPSAPIVPRRVDRPLNSVSPIPPIASGSGGVGTDDEWKRTVRGSDSRRTAGGGSSLDPQGRRLFDPNAPAQSTSARRLFDPDKDPVIPARPTQSTSTPNPSLSSSTAVPRPLRSLLVRPSANARTPDEQADRERERQRRREGSERGSGSSRRHHAKDGDTRSKGSRSSEGSESLKDRERGRGDGDNGAKALLRASYKEIQNLEQALTEMHKKMSSDPEAGISVLLDKTVERHRNSSGSSNSDDSQAWAELVALHKELADCHYNFLKLALDPMVPPGLRPLPIKYNIPVRLWQIGFHLLLERLRFAWMSHYPAALDFLTDFIYDSYQFYTELLDDQVLSNFRTAWIEALGDLARYRMAVASTITPELPKRHGQRQGGGEHDDGECGRPPRSGASIGQEVADEWVVEDTETWRTTARDWYALGITEKPGEGRLHHHLALLSRDVRGQEGRALYHFAKSLTASHPFETSRESILPLFDASLQLQRSTPEATAMDLFVRLHGMLFTKIDLDHFPTVMSRFMERLEEDASLDGVSRKAGVTQVDWLMMGTVNLSAVLQYGSEAGVIRKALVSGGAAARRRNNLAEEAGEVGGEVGDGEDGEAVTTTETITDDVDIGSTPTVPTIESPSNANDSTPPPPTFKLALEFTFAVFDFVLTHPYRQQGIHKVLNPYIIILLTFLATIFRDPSAGSHILPFIPWRSLAQFIDQHLRTEIREETRLITAAAPLPEDWSMRGMEWVGRRVYERGFWKSKQNSGRGSSGGPGQPRVGERFQSEIDVLTANFDSALDITEGVVDDVDGADLTDGPVAINQRRKKRAIWAIGVLAAYVDGLELHSAVVKAEMGGAVGQGENGGGGGYGSGPVTQLVIKGALEVAINRAEAEAEALAKEEEERRVRSSMLGSIAIQSGVDGSGQKGIMVLDMESEEEDDDPDLAILRERRRHLREVLNAPASRAPRASQQQRQQYQRGIPRQPGGGGYLGKRTPRVVPGYTMLVFDTNVLLSALNQFSKVVEGGQWSVVVPLPVVTELDGLSRNPPPLGPAAQKAVAYLEARIRTHALCLKIQTSRGNYLTDLLIRAEQLDFRSRSAPKGNAVLATSGNSVTEDIGGSARTMDDLILDIAKFQSDHFVDRSALLGMDLDERDRSNGSGDGHQQQPKSTKVLLVTFDRNMRLKARSRGIETADEKEMAAILGKT